MLQTIREKAQGWIAWVIVILISVPFALWGIQEYLGVGSAVIKASVNDREITEREFENNYRMFREQLRQRMGKSYRPDLVDDKLLRKEMLQSIIKRELIHQQAVELGMRTSDEVLRDIIKKSPTFLVGGKFNQATYENAARRQGFTTDGYELQMRQLLVSDQLTRAIRDSEIVTQAELEQNLRLKDQKRKMTYLVISATDYIASVEVKQQDVDSHYNNNKQSFMSPERVKLEYLELDIKNIAKTVKVEEDELLGYYEQNKSNYIVPEGRRASHILITVDGSAEEAAVTNARETAEAALNRIKSGEDFATVAKELSQDPGSAKNGGDLGFFGKGIMDPAFEKAAFELETGAISDLVKSTFGFHIIKLIDIRLPKGKTFEQAKDDLLDAYRKEEAGRLFYEYAERLGDMAYEDPDSLEPAADALGLKVQSSDWIGRDGGKGVLASDRVVSTAFSEDVLNQRHNSELMELGAEHVLVLRVVEHEESQVKPMEKVQGEIESIFKKRAASKLAEQKGKEIIAVLKEGLSIDKAATDHNAQLNLASEIDRASQKVPREILDTLFKMPRPEGENMVYGKTSMVSGDYAVIALEKVTDGLLQDLNDDERSKQRLSMQRMLGTSSFDHMIENMRKRSEIVITEEKK